MKSICTNKIGHVLRNFGAGRNSKTQCKFCGKTKAAIDKENKEKEED